MLLCRGVGAKWVTDKIPPMIGRFNLPPESLAQNYGGPLVQNTNAKAKTQTQEHFAWASCVTKPGYRA